MARKYGSKVTHHCWCGQTGWCRKHLLRCEAHGIDYYASGGCQACEGVADAADRKEYKERQDQKKQAEDAKRKEEDAWFTRTKGRK